MFLMPKWKFFWKQSYRFKFSYFIRNMKKKNSIQIKFLLEGNIGKTGNILKNRKKKMLGGQRANGQITREKYFGRKKNSFSRNSIFYVSEKGYYYVFSPTLSCENLLLWWSASDVDFFVENVRCMYSLIIVPSGSSEENKFFRVKIMAIDGS